MNEDKSNCSISHVDCTKNISVFSKIRKGRRIRRCFRCTEKGHFIASCPHMKNQDRASPKMTNKKEMSKEQTTCTTEHHICYNCHEKGRLKKFCAKGKTPKQNTSNHSYVLKKPKYDTCARTMMSSHRFNTNDIWVPKR
jgi:hypothetical protein